MNRLAIDPGVSNGWAFFRQDEWIASGVWPADELQGAIDFWRSLSADRVLIERIPGLTFGPMGIQLASIVSKIDRAFPDGVWILPGQWKPVTGTWPLPGGIDTKTTHERDAIRMVLFDLHRTSSRSA